MKKASSIRKVLLISGTAIATFAAVQGIAFAAPPQQLPANAEAMDQRFQPAMDYGADGCYPTPAVGADGTVNGGLKPSGALDGGCRDRSDLDGANMYSRSKCNNGWCAIAYGLYFEKDQAVAGAGLGGHRHDWEHVVVWVQDDQVRFVSASQHGGFDTQPSDVVRFDGDTHPTIEYFKDGLGTHAFRFAEPGDESPMNETGAWHFPALVGFDGFPPGVRDKLTGYDFGAATFALKDGEFNEALAKARPAGIPFDPNA